MRRDHPGGADLTIRQFRMLVKVAGLCLVSAARMCATTPARALGLQGTGAIESGAAADLVVLDAEFRVLRTYIGGELAWPLPR